MTDPQTTTAQPRAPNSRPPVRKPAGRLHRVLRVLITLAAVAVAIPFVWEFWKVYMASPWTRDGTVRAYVVTMAPEIFGRIVELPVKDNQLVTKGDLLIVIEPTNYQIAVKSGEADVERTKAAAIVAKADYERRLKLMSAAVSEEEKQTFRAKWLSAEADYRSAQARLEQARVNLKRTRIYSPVNGYVTNLLAQLGDYARTGENLISLVNADSFWVDGYFEETNLEGIRAGSPATVKLMGYDAVLRGHVNSIARGINVPNAQPNGEGLAQVNPIFTWVRLAQRIPVRIHIDEVPEGVVLAAGMTATVQIDITGPPVPKPRPADSVTDKTASRAPAAPAASRAR
jgi:multidrug resistance efflux pump